MRLKTVTTTLLFMLVLAPAAIAGRPDNGEGLMGEINDRIITYGGFLAMTFFVLFISLASLLQWKLDKRKAARMAGHNTAANRYLGGW